MQHLKNFNWKKFLLQGVRPLPRWAVAVGFHLPLSAGAVRRRDRELFAASMAALRAAQRADRLCLTLILFALLGKWSRATGISGAVFTVIALINYYTRDLHARR